MLFEIPVSAHHSFAMYDQTKIVTLTGVVKQFVPQANHAELHFILLAPDHKALAKGADGKYVEWGVEMAGTAAVAQQGITGTTFPPGTVFSVKLNPLRDGSNFGSRVGALAKCPTDPATNKPKLPEPASTATRVAGPHADRRQRVLTPPIVKQFALLAVHDVPERLHSGAQHLGDPRDSVDSHRRDRDGHGIRADDRSADPRDGRGLIRRCGRRRAASVPG